MVTGVFALMTLLAFALSIPLAAEKVPRNNFYGFRTPRTVKDDRVWYPVNRVAGRNGIVMGMILALSTVLYGLGILAAGTLVPALVAITLFGLISTFVSASKIVQQVDKGGPLIDYSSSLSYKRDKSTTMATT